MFDMRLAWHYLILWLNSSLGELGAGAATVLTHIPPSEMTTQFAVGHTVARPKDHSKDVGVLCLPVRFASTLHLFARPHASDISSLGNRAGIGTCLRRHRYRINRGCFLSRRFPTETHTDDYFADQEHHR